MKQIGDILGAFFDENTLAKAKGYAGVFSAWENLTRKCGLAVAASHSRIMSLERSILLVEADHPGWIQLLQTKQSELLEKVRADFPNLGIRGISFTLFRK